MPTRVAWSLALVTMVALGASGCTKTNDPATGAPAGAAAEGRALLEAGKLDEAASRLLAAGDDPDALYDLGRVWVRRAETAPLPTPPPPPSPIPRGWEPPPPPEFKPEEQEAVKAFEKALLARPDHPPAHLALAQLLAPHAIRVYERNQAAQGKRGRKAPVAADTGGVDLAPARIVRSYELAMAAQPVLPGALEGLQRFAERTDDLEAAEKALRERIRRAGGSAESVEPHIQYGDFLVAMKKDPTAAVEEYRQALIWRPDDDATRGKLADIYIAQGVDSYGKQQYATAEARFTEAERYITDRQSPQGATLREYKSRLAAIRN